MIKKCEFNNIAFLSRIYVNEQEVNKYITDLNKMVTAVNILQEVNTDNVIPTTHMTSMRNIWRQDTVKSSTNSVKKILFNNAPEAENCFYKIRKVLNI
ncbi:MAG: Asp-tRNA(Asn)/Glu-tRNA(Gln) amidotransferase subunit GatC [Endomicrobium sp.]|jgi:aspartyl-tRNA(Asn)/glutamyl-tRNA(Gln) amidotransferase subunit C|nr:Asp-tRNA(Asn)/Glu-tRNA(Gln) amidotransferase subunit GatC [Endomicrobium sp.]